MLQLLTTDHSLINHCLRWGKPVGSDRTKVTRALGTRRTVEVEATVITSQPGDVFLLSTDGVHGIVGHEELSELLVRNPDPEAAVEEIVARANARGGIDNITATVLRWDR